MRAPRVGQLRSGDVCPRSIYGTPHPFIPFIVGFLLNIATLALACKRTLTHIVIVALRSA